MKVVFTSYGMDSNEKMHPNFGRANYFLLYDSDTQTWSFQPNIQNVEAAHGAGIQAAQTIAQMGAEVLVTGNVGPKAFKVLRANGIKVYSAVELSAAEALAAFQSGKLSPLIEPGPTGYGK